MKLKQKATMKRPKNNSALMKRLVLWIFTTNSTGGVTYTQIKTFLDSKVKGDSTSCDAKLIITTLQDTGHLAKIGYKYVAVSKRRIKKVSELVPTVRKSQKPTVRKSVVNLPKSTKNVLKSVPAVKVKRSPGTLDVRDGTSVENSPMEVTEKVSIGEVPNESVAVANDTTVTEDKTVEVELSTGTLGVHDGTIAENPTMEGTGDVSNGEMTYHSTNMDVTADKTMPEDSAVTEK